VRRKKHIHLTISLTFERLKKSKIKEKNLEGFSEKYNNLPHLQ